MFCKRCGKELLEGARFCPECGEPVGVENEEIATTIEEYESTYNDHVDAEEVKPHVPRCFYVFGNVGFALAIVGFVCNFIPFLCFSTYQASIVGLVFSILGKRAPELANKTKKGRVFSILGLVFGMIMMIVSCVIMALNGEFDYSMYM